MNISIDLEREKLVENLKKFSFKPTIHAGTKNEVNYDFPLRCLLSLVQDQEQVSYKIIADCYKQAKGDQSVFVDLFLAHKELNYTQGYGEIAKCYPDKLWYLMRSLFGDKEFKTESDAGSVCIAAKDYSFSILVPNGYGDGETRVAIFEEKYDALEHLMTYHTVIEGNFLILNYDCLHLNHIQPATIAKELNGRFGIYYKNGFVAFERWDDRN